MDSRPSQVSRQRGAAGRKDDARMASRSLGKGHSIENVQLSQVLWIVSLSQSSFREAAGAEASEPSAEMDQVVSQELHTQRSTVT